MHFGSEVHRYGTRFWGIWLFYLHPHAFIYCQLERNESYLPTFAVGELQCHRSMVCSSGKQRHVHNLSAFSFWTMLGPCIAIKHYIAINQEMKRGREHFSTMTTNLTDIQDSWLCDIISLYICCKRIVGSQLCTWLPAHTLQSCAFRSDKRRTENRKSGKGKDVNSQGKGMPL